MGIQGPILITGGGGFLGQTLVRRFRDLGLEVVAPRRAEWDLRDPGQVKGLYRSVQPEVLVHAAVHGGGIGYMQQCPADVYFDNMMMNTLILHEAYAQGVKKLISIGTVCSYPKLSAVPFLESDLWDGYPEATNSAYGLAKKMMIVQLQAYHQQYGIQGFQLLLANLYGPGDNFNPSSSHVIPALIRKLVEAKEQGQGMVSLWGTGEATREFLFVEDAAEAVIQACMRYNGLDPVNVGVGQDISIAELVKLLRDLIGYTGDIRWDHSKPDGQPRRCLDVSRAYEEFGFQATTSLEQGLKKTLDWFLEQRMEHALVS